MGIEAVAEPLGPVPYTFKHKISLSLAHTHVHVVHYQIITTLVCSQPYKIAVRLFQSQYAALAS